MAAAKAKAIIAREQGTVTVTIETIGSDEPEVLKLRTGSKSAFPDIHLRFQPKQRELLRMVEEGRATIIGNGGSKGSAKSYGGRAIMLLRRLKYPGTTGMIFRRKFKQHRENTLEKGYFKDLPFMRHGFEAPCQSSRHLSPLTVDNAT